MQEGGGGLETAGGAEPRSAWRLIVATFRLYRRFPLLFVALAGIVVVPYVAIVAATTGDGPLSDSVRSAQLEFFLSLSTWCLVTPLISALHINAVAEVREGRSPQFAAVLRVGLRVLPVVVAASVMSGLGIFLGFLALVVPGIYLTLRWIVVAQAAAIEREGWLPALRSSGRLVSGNYGHVFLFLVLVFATLMAVTFVIAFAVADRFPEAITFLVELALEVAIYSFTALATALLYFDLRLRHETAPAPSTSESPSPDSDEDSAGGRPKGWYVDPDNPSRMRYWAGESNGWVANTKTPRKVRKELKGKEGPGQ